MDDTVLVRDITAPGATWYGVCNLQETLATLTCAASANALRCDWMTAAQESMARCAVAMAPSVQHAAAEPSAATSCQRSKSASGGPAEGTAGDGRAANTDSTVSGAYSCWGGEVTGVGVRAGRGGRGEAGGGCATGESLRVGCVAGEDASETAGASLAAAAGGCLWPPDPATGLGAVGCGRWTRWRQPHRSAWDEGWGRNLGAGDGRSEAGTRTAQGARAPRQPHEGDGSQRPGCCADLRVHLLLHDSRASRPLYWQAMHAV